MTNVAIATNTSIANAQIMSDWPSSLLRAILRFGVVAAERSLLPTLCFLDIAFLAPHGFSGNGINTCGIGNLERLL
jgi:hypothetical protein